MNQIRKRDVDKHVGMIKHLQKMHEFDSKHYDGVLSHANAMSVELFGNENRWIDINDYIRAMVALNPDITNENIYEALRCVGIFVVAKKK